MKVRATYCIASIIALLTCTFAGATVKMIEGETGREAKYLLAMPDSWNGDLVVYAHGIVSLETMNRIGKLVMPHLALHNSRDPAVPVFHQEIYAAKVLSQGDEDQLVQRISDRYGHTKPFKAPEVFGAFEELVDWVNTGIGPVP